MIPFKIRVQRLLLFLTVVAVLIGTVFGARFAKAQQGAIERPAASTLQNGDLIWPKNPKAIVPYDSSSETAREAVQKQWETERDAFVARVRKDPASTPATLQLATNLEALSYSEFTLRYLADIQKSDIEKYGGIDDILSVGHVGIVEVASDGQRFVIEAVWGSIKKVQRVSYADWLNGRANSWVWVGRLSGVPDATKQKFVEQAKSYLGRPYDFWNFDLGDDSSFYCSKLVWLSYAKSVGTYLDGSTGQRGFWFSPKQLWKRTDRIERVNVPRDYSY